MRWIHLFHPNCPRPTMSVLTPKSKPISCLDIILYQLIHCQRVLMYIVSIGILHKGPQGIHLILTRSHLKWAHMQSVHTDWTTIVCMYDFGVGLGVPHTTNANGIVWTTYAFKNDNFPTLHTYIHINGIGTLRVPKPPEICKCELGNLQDKGKGRRIRSPMHFHLTILSRARTHR